MEHATLGTATVSWCVAVIEDGHWRPGIGDPTVAGWATVIAYVAACALCIWTATKAPTSLAPIDISKHRMFWGALSLIMLLLALNKQLDVQLWFWLTGRNMIKANGWYQQRRVLQLGWIAAIALVAGAGLAYFTWLTRGQSRQRLLALVGVVFTTCFVLVRAGSLHHVDSVLGWRVGGLRMNTILENGGILLVLVGALKAVRVSTSLGNDASKRR